MPKSSGSEWPKLKERLAYVAQAFHEQADGSQRQTFWIVKVSLQGRIQDFF